jgi:hypothetical protein
MRDPSLWRQMDTAPQDGTEVLVFVDGHVAVAASNGGRWYGMVAGKRADDSTGAVDLGTPTHWRPLPPPPGSTELLHT